MSATRTPLRRSHARRHVATQGVRDLNHRAQGRIGKGRDPSSGRVIRRAISLVDLAGVTQLARRASRSGAPGHGQLGHRSRRTRRRRCPGGRRRHRHRGTQRLALSARVASTQASQFELLVGRIVTLALEALQVGRQIERRPARLGKAHALGWEANDSSQASRIMSVATATSTPFSTVPAMAAEQSGHTVIG